ncbi:hypothetical protein [Tepidiforma bonchosmolovskayae]|uniref:Gram-positive cocci surface proteins LPxTG domain-containing protein n=1 Tax=Tepidiforma bonchosmolovskayae TaxID=2601677 RepID=A0ABX6BZD3_9CHLR|nr:hypothetical protein [Tepidiforma bonchosmolovskayae]QFG02360.1 hypothetical protein Tbon_03315 [Tepidiforma bonchosmolovskayae]
MRILLPLAAALLAAGTAAAAAQPQIPATVYGSVTIDGQPAPNGTEVRAFIGSTDCTQAAPGERLAFREGQATAYVVTVLHESQRPGCGRTGAVITFTVDGRPALQSVAWEPGPIRLDLSLGSPTVIPLPTATPTLPGAASPTARPAPTGPPPTDDVALPGTLVPSPPDVRAAGDPRSGGSGAPLWPWLAGALLVLAAGAAAAVVALRRRRD